MYICSQLFALFYRRAIVFFEINFCPLHLVKKKEEVSFIRCAQPFCPRFPQATIHKASVGFSFNLKDLLGGLLNENAG